MALSSNIIMVASGKGGTGKSTCAVLLGSRLAAGGKSVLLIELDSGLRSVDIIGGVCGNTVYDLEDVLCGRCEGSKAVAESSVYPGLSLISAPYEGGIVREGALKVLVSTMARVFDYIVIDTAAGMGAPFRAAASVSSTALLVLTPDPVALRDGRIVCDELHRLDVPNIRLVINRLGRAGFAKGAAVKDLDECIDTVGAQLIAVVPESAEVATAAANGTALVQSCLAFSAFDRLAQRLQGHHIPLAIPRTGF